MQADRDRHRVSLVADVAELVSRSHDLAETLANVTDLVAKRLDADVCSVYLTDPTLSHLVLKATKGLDPAAVDRVRMDVGEGLVGLAAETGQVAAYEHASQAPNYRHFPETGEDRYESLLAAPLNLRGVVIGVLVIQTLEPRVFEQPDIDLLQTCARQLTPVVINAQLLSMVETSDAERTEIVDALTRAGVGGLRNRAPAAPAEISGTPTARGYAIGPIHHLSVTSLDRLEYESSGDPARERQNLLDAIANARRELDDTRDLMGERFGPEFSAIFHTQIQILEDKGFVQAIERAAEREANAVEALRSVLDHYRRTFERIEDPYFRERGADIEDVGRRVLECLVGARSSSKEALPRGAIVVVDQMLAGLFARLEIDRVGAIVSEHGGATSHGAIFARTLEIPAVTGASGVIAAAREGELAIVDGGTGRILLSPDDSMLVEYRAALERYAVTVEHLDALRGRPAETRDGRRIKLTANLGLLADVRLIEQHGAEGVGLFRTELLALAHGGFPSEEEQERLYERVAGLLAPRPVTVRTLDLGGDKGLPTLGLADEDNPQLGCRSIRLTLENQAEFLSQLRAILRSSTQRNVRLLLPMISSIEELWEAQKLIEQAKSDLRERGDEFDDQIPVGVMIEVPSAAILAPVLAAECDFFSIGTNDLTQYTLAVDRGNERVAHLFQPLHPAVLRLIDQTTRAARRAGIPVSVCGEMASNPLAVPLLIGIGIGELSGVPSAVPLVKEITRAFDAGTADGVARDALAASSATAVQDIAAAALREAGLLEHPDIGEWLRGLMPRA